MRTERCAEVVAQTAAIATSRSNTRRSIVAARAIARLEWLRTGTLFIHAQTRMQNYVIKRTVRLHINRYQNADIAVNASKNFPLSSTFISITAN